MRVLCGFLTIGLLQLSLGPVEAGWAASLSATQPSNQLELNALIAEALANNPELVSARTRWQAAQQKIPLSKGLPAPRIGVEWENIPRGSVKFNQAELMYQLIQSLPFPGKLSAKHRVAVKDAQIAATAFKQAEWDIVTQVKAIYYELFLLDRELDATQQERLWFAQASATAQARYASGTGTQAEVLMAQGQLMEAINALGVLQHRRLAMAAHLNHLLNHPAHHEIGQPAPFHLQPIPLTPEELILIAQDRQPELLAFQFSAERADAALKLAKRELLPDLETMVELRDPAMGPFGPWDLSLALVLPFWFWTKLKYGVKAAIYDQASAHAAYQAMQNEIARRIHEHWHEAQASYETAKLCEDGLIKLSEQGVASSLAAYQGGRAPYSDVLESLRMWSERQRTYAEHVVQFEQHVVMLEQAVGMSLHGTVIPEPIPSEGGAR